MSDVSIVVVNWNTRDLLRSCLKSIVGETERAKQWTCEVIVADNSSDDGSARMLREEFEWVRLIESGRNLGFAAANNLALSYASGRYTLLLNPDTVLLSGSLSTLLDFMSSNPEAGAVGPMLLNPDGTLQASSYPAPTLFRELWRLLHVDRLWRNASYPLEDWLSSGPRPVDVIQGACLMLRRQALEQVGQLDPDYFMYTEEVDLCLRLRRAGWKVYWLPSSKVVHHGGQSTKLASQHMFLELYRSKVHYFRKHYGGPAALAYKLILTIAAAARLLASPVALFGRGESRSRHLTVVGNYIRLLNKLHSM